MSQDWIARGREVITIEIEALESVRHNLDAAFAGAVNLLAACAGRVAVTGIGKSGLVGRKIAATLSSTGTPAYFLHPVEGAHGDLGAVRAGDVIIAISYSGKTDELNAILPALRSLGARIIAITGGASSPLANMADIVLDAHVPREACALDLVPTSSTTAALAVGDALAVCLMQAKAFSSGDFRRFHPGGDLGRRLSLKVADLMHYEDIPVAPDASSVAEALAVLDRGGFGAVLLADAKGRLTGILTDGDVRRMLCRKGFDPSGPVTAVMTANPLSVDEDMSAAELMDIMEEKAITVLPVTGSGKALRGLVHMHDLLGKGQIRFSGTA